MNRRKNLSKIRVFLKLKTVRKIHRIVSEAENTCVCRFNVALSNTKKNFEIRSIPGEPINFEVRLF